MSERVAVRVGDRDWQIFRSFGISSQSYFVGWIGPGGADHVSCNSEVDLGGRDVEIGGQAIQSWIVDV